MASDYAAKRGEVDMGGGGGWGWFAVIQFCAHPHTMGAMHQQEHLGLHTTADDATNRDKWTLPHWAPWHSELMGLVLKSSPYRPRRLLTLVASVLDLDKITKIH